VPLRGYCPLLYTINARLTQETSDDKGAFSGKEDDPRSDKSGAEIPEGKGASVRITFADARKGVRELDLTDTEAEQLGGRAVARRGRRPKSQS
jgi:hypothetical protein